ncbi:MAG: 50S ribosomal protein L30 [Firmicutes bacterium HGW-Firmicutes-14]|nr:MAG: 50S ribosomal protein L30 [Firmicutes bacterium HGW-Firmicutes-14]
MGKLKVKLVKSVIGSSKAQRATVETLGLGKINSSAEHDDSPQIRGMIRKVEHLVEVEEVE